MTGFYDQYLERFQKTSFSMPWKHLKLLNNPLFVFLKKFILNNNVIENTGYKFDLQRFASAEAEGRSEKATEHKKRKAREEGRVALSKDLPATLITLFCFITIYFLAANFYQILHDTFVYAFDNISKFNLKDSDVYLDILLLPFLKIFLPIAAIAFIVGVLSNYLQIGLKITVKAIKPNFKRISPNIFKFFKNQVFSVTGFFNLIKSMIKVGIIGLVAYFTITGKLEELKSTLFIDNVFYSLILIADLAFSLVIKSVIIFLFFSIIDIIFVRWQYEESLKMKKEEIKQEYKELYGDPNVRMRLRQMYQNMMSQKKMLAEVPKADVVITNPTHFAVALFYDKYIDDAPRVIAKGKDRFAEAIKSVAREHEIFMYENVALARTLYNEVEVNEFIPRTLYGVVINAYKLAMQHKEKQAV